MMVTREIVGARIREVRTSQRKTLKEIEAVSGFSSTHISEIERGRTSPTVGALIRIAQALDKDPSFFIEERVLDEICITSGEDRPCGPLGIKVSGSGHQVTGLTRGILGGRMVAFELVLEPLGIAQFDKLPDTGDLLFFCLAGRAEIGAGEQSEPFREGDSLHLEADDAKLTIRGGGDVETRILVVIDPRESSA